VVKNKVAAPFKVTEFDIIYNEGISMEGEMLALGEKFGIVGKSGASFSYISKDKDGKEEKLPLGRGYDATRQFLRSKEGKAIKDKIFKEITNRIKNDGLSFTASTSESDEGSEPEE
jgi:recombination protein RecA